MDTTIPASAPKKRLEFVEAIRAYAILGVVLAHVVDPILSSFNTVEPLAWWAANFYSAVFRPSATLFVLVSGVLLLDPKKDEPLGVFFRKRFDRLALPLIFWSVLYLVSNAYWDGTPLSVVDIFKRVLAGPVITPFWFMYMIIGLYLATPILRVYIRHTDETTLRYFIGLWFVAASILPAVEKFVGVHVGIEWFLATDVIGYYLLGHYLRETTLNAQQVKQMLLLLVGGRVFVAAGTFVLTSSAGGVLDDWLCAHLAPSGILLVVGTFLLLKSVPYERLYARSPRFKQLVKVVSATSFSIYLMHALILKLLEHGLSLTGMTIHPIIGVPLTTGVIIVLSVAATLILERIPIVRLVIS